MARSNVVEGPKRTAITPTPTRANGQKAQIKPKGIEGPKKEEQSIQPKRRTLQDRRPALRDLSKPVERKIISKPVYSKQEGTITKAILETKEVIPTPARSAPKLEPKEPIPKVRPKGKSALSNRAVGTDLVYAREQQERAIEEARAAAAAKEREKGKSILESEQERREKWEAGYRLSLDNQGRFHRGR